MHTAYLLLGGNMGNREKMLDRALFELGKTGRIVAVSVKRKPNHGDLKRLWPLSLTRQYVWKRYWIPKR